MDKKLYEASLAGNVQVLNALLQEDQLILDRVSLTSFNETPLHVAALRGHLDFARALIRHKPKLATAVDSSRRSPLHLASAEGHVEIVRELLRVMGPAHVGSQDQDGRTPLHLAAMNERVEVIEALIQARPAVAAAVEGSDPILHMCVRYNRFEALKLLVAAWNSDDEVAKLKDGDGNTLLHLAAIHKQIETIKYLLSKSSIRANGNAVNGHGLTANDVLDHCPRDFRVLEIQEILMEAGIERAKGLRPHPKVPPPSTTKKSAGTQRTTQSVTDSSDGKSRRRRGCMSVTWDWYAANDGNKWWEKERGVLILAATVIVAMTFHAVVNPPGGTFTDSSNGHIRGNSIQADLDIDVFSRFLTLNTTVMIIAISIVLLLLSGFSLKNKFVMWLLTSGVLATIVFLLLTYFHTVAMMLPDMWVNPPTAYLCVVWVFICALFGLVHTIFFLVWVIKKLSSKCRSGRTTDRLRAATSEDAVDV